MYPLLKDVWDTLLAGDSFIFVGNPSETWTITAITNEEIYFVNLAAPAARNYRNSKAFYGVYPVIIQDQEQSINRILLNICKGLPISPEGMKKIKDHINAEISKS